MAIDKNDPEIKALIEEASEAAVEEATETLKEKTTELLRKLKKANATATIDPAEHQLLTERVAELEGQVTEAQKQLKTAQTEATMTKKALDAETGAVSKLLIDNGLSAALLEAGVKKPGRLKGAKAILASQVTIKVDGENRTAIIGDKPLKEAVSEWIMTDEGKEYAEAPVNIGASAPGSGDIKPGGEDLSKMSPEARLTQINLQTAGKKE